MCIGAVVSDDGIFLAYFAKMFEIQIIIAIFAAHFEGVSPEKWTQIII